MIRIACAGALIAGAYGALHDQISYSISPEYFTKMKFAQFRWADVGLPARAHASEVGLLATWWVGMFAGWFMARAGLDEMEAARRRGVMRRGFVIMLGAAGACGAGGALCGWLVSRGDLSGWREWEERLSLRDLRGFVIVAWMHRAGYVGALAGMIGAIVFVQGRRGNAAAAGLTGRG